MLKHLVSFVFVLSVTHAISATPIKKPQVDLCYAKYTGTYNVTTNSTRFLGIRYAAPPIGNFRWEAPQLPSPVREVQPADTMPPTCLAGTQGLASTNPDATEGILTRSAASASEDCLFLNVYVPGQLTPHKKLPVVIWIHGGGYAIGGASTYNGDELLRNSNNGAIVVIIQYRLGIFGFLAGTEVHKHGALNAGLLDQRFTFRWVQEHIAKFGGDPGHVTIWGESAGASSVLEHLVADEGHTVPPLFKGVITSSTAMVPQYPYNDTIVERLYSEVVSQANCTAAASSLGCLRAADVSTIQAANLKIGAAGFYGTYVFVPVIGGSLVNRRPLEILREGKFNGEFFLSVTNTFEGTIFIDPKTPPTVSMVTNYIQNLFPKFGAGEIAAASSLYKDMGSPTDQMSAIIGEAVLICPTYNLLKTYGGRGYKGEFAVPPGEHGDDLSYYFPTHKAPAGNLARNDPVFRKAFSESFMNFVMSFDPNVKSDPENITPHWQMWNGNGKAEILFNVTDAGEADVRQVETSGDLLRRCSFWASVGELTGQ